MHIKFSVVINTFERETQILDLKNCFKSIFSQTHEPDEIILIHSGDEKFEKIHLGILSDKIRVINCPKKTNISEARNIGAKNCKNNYLAFIDDDDLWGKNYLKISYEFIKKNKSKTILSTVYVTNHEKKEILFRSPRSSKIEDYFNVNIGAMGSNLIIEKSEFELAKGFDTNLTVSEDKGIIMDLILKKRKIHFQENYVWYNLKTPNSITKQPQKMVDGLSAFLDKYKDFMNYRNRFFITKKIYSYKKKVNKIYFIHFVFMFFINKLLN